MRPVTKRFVGALTTPTQKKWLPLVGLNQISFMITQLHVPLDLARTSLSNSDLHL